VIVPAYSQQLLAAVLGFVGLHVLVNTADWVLRAPRSGRLVRLAESSRAWIAGLWLGDVVRVFFYLLAPYFVLTRGLASPLDFGLADLEWLSGLGLTLAIGAGSCVLLLAVWSQYVRRMDASAVYWQTHRAVQRQGWPFALREALLLESWWALCRSPMLQLAGPYHGAYLGLVLALSAGLLNPHTRQQLRTPGFREEVVLTASLAILTATLYVFVHNLWLCIALHFALRLTVLALLRHSAPPGHVEAPSPA
jgi:hypothetical protein